MSIVITFLRYLGQPQIIYVGNDAQAHKGDATEVVDAGGKMVLPGFQDTHIHIHDTGTEFCHAAVLYHCRTVKDLQEAMAKFAAEHPDNESIRGTGMDVAYFSADNLTRHDIDEVISDRPVYIMANDGHNAIYNTFACEKYGVVKGAEDPENGHFVLDEDGVPTGFMYEDAIWWGVKQLPKHTKEDMKDGVRFGAAHANQHGITGVLDAMISRHYLGLSKELEDAGELNVRIRSTYKIKPSDSNIDDVLDNLKDMREAYKSDMLSMHSAKFFLDGVFENKTAALLEPDAEGDNAPVMFDEEHLRELIVACDREKFQCHLHTIGDKATRVGLDCVEAALDANGDWGALHQFAHLQLVHPDDIPRFAKLKAVANYQPLWAVPDDELVELIGEERAKYVYPLGSMVRDGAPYAISSDWGVSTLNPFEIMQVAVTRQNIDLSEDDRSFLPEECITVEEVVKGYTIHAAECAWRADTTGTLEVGKFADIIMIDQDIYDVPVHDLHKTKVLMTMVDGRVVHEAA